MAPRSAKPPATAAVPPARQPGAKPDAPPDGYTEETRAIRVTVRSFYVPDKSDPDDSNYFWAYKIRIENRGRETVQLMKRSWHIVDALGRTKRVHGDGVVGYQPVLEPGEAFEYTSGTPLETPSGFMGGFYHMVLPSSGEAFDIRIPTFSLDSPHQAGRLH